MQTDLTLVMQDLYKSFTLTLDITVKQVVLDISTSASMVEEGYQFILSYHFALITTIMFCRQPFCSNTTNVNLCSHIWSICYLAQSVFDKNEIIAEPCLRKCPSGVNLSPMSVIRPERTPKNRYGFALNYGIPMGQSTPKTWFEWNLIDKWFVYFSTVFFFTVQAAHFVLNVPSHLSVRSAIVILAINDAA